jgi:hypothetical protein
MIKATIQYVDGTVEEHEGDGGGFDPHTNWWLLFKDNEPIMAVPREMIFNVTYTNVEEKKERPEYTH